MTDEDIHLFCEEEESENTKRKTFYDIKVFLQFLNSENEARNIHEIPPKGLDPVHTYPDKFENVKILICF